MGPSILLVWGNVGPHFVTIFGLNTLHINTCFVTFWHLLYHIAHHLSLRGMNENKVYVNFVYYYHFMILMIKIDMI